MASGNLVDYMMSIGKEGETKFMENLDSTKQRVIDSASKSTVVNDSYGNSLTATGTQDKVQSFTNYGLSNDTLNWPLWMALYNDSWVFRRAIDKPACDEVRCGITIKSDVDVEPVYAALNKFSFDLIQLLQWGALFGGSIGVIMMDNMKDEDYANPLSPSKLKEAKSLRMYVVDRWYGVACDMFDTVTDMNSIDFGKPKFYNVTFPDGKQLKVHHDFVLRYEHRTAPKLIKNGQLQGWGYAEGAHILNELSRDDELKSAITSLINKSLIEVIKMSGMRGVFMGADKNNEDQLRKRLEMVNWGRNFNSLTFLDKDDDYEMNTFGGVSGLADLLETNMWLISAAIEMPGILFGELKGGLAAESEALERYDETILNRCENYYRPVLTKLISLLYKKFGIDEAVEFSFNSLLLKKHDREKMEGLKYYQELLSALLQDGVITTKQYAQSIMNYTQNNTIDLSFTEEELKELENRTEEEMENIDLDEFNVKE